jgi:hypothetical protein
MSVETEPRPGVLYAESRGRKDTTESRLSRLLLRAIDAYDSHNGKGPTVSELAADLGIPPDFGHHDLVGRLQRELSLGRLSHYGSRFRLTQAGRDLAGADG